MRCRLSGYLYCEIIPSLMSVYFCGGSCIEDVTTHLMYHLSLHPTLRTCSADTILRAIKELTQENISYTSDKGKTYDFNTADNLNTLLMNCLFATGQLKVGEMCDVDFDHQFIEAEKYDAKPTYKKFLGYRPGEAVIGDLIVGSIEIIGLALVGSKGDVFLCQFLDGSEDGIRAACTKGRMIREMAKS